jgi:hypothetical protein
MSACDGAVEESPSDVNESELFVKTSYKWNYNILPNGPKVCWLKGLSLPAPANYYATERQWVQDQVQKTWSANSRAKFQWNGVCPYNGALGCHNNPACNTVFVMIEDSGPHTAWLGTGGANYNTVYLNFTFNNWSQGCQSSRESCIRSIAVHEFGHVLSFSHEQNRNDTPSWCNDVQGPNGDLKYGAWDLSSVMNYCNPTWNNGGVLSATDIQGVQYVYGAP